MKENSLPKTKPTKSELDEMIREVAENEGMTFEEAKRLFLEGMSKAISQKKTDINKKSKNRAKNKQAKKSRKKNR